jgi:ferredoxin-type protein NapF
LISINCLQGNPGFLISLKNLTRRVDVMSQVALHEARMDKSSQVRRRQFLRGDFSGRRSPIRPPWSRTEDVFIEDCDRCGDCLKACEEGIIKVGGGGFPEIDFTRGGCSFCGDCVTACKGKALVGDVQAPSTAWSLRARIETDCLAHRGVECRACGERCDTRAIVFRPRVGGVAEPRLETELCNGCGECFAVCPVRAVRIGPPEQQSKAVRGGATES